MVSPCWSSYPIRVTGHSDPIIRSTEHRPPETFRDLEPEYISAASSPLATSRRFTLHEDGQAASMASVVEVSLEKLESSSKLP